MRNQAMQNIFKERYHVEPADLQKYNLLLTIPMLFRMFFGMLVDSKVAKERKYYIITMNALQSMAMYSIASMVCGTPE